MIRIATRRSALAMAQARTVGDRLRAAHPGLSVSLRPVTTTGDRDRTGGVAMLTEVGAFVRAVQQEVLDGRADLAVHSCKDLPVDGPSELVAVYTEREAPWDVLCGSTLAGLAPGDVVGTGSPRRAAQLRRLLPDVGTRHIRGNVETRLAAIAGEGCRAVVLAEAGLRRLGLAHRIDHRFGLEEMVPAAGQGALAVEVVSGGEAHRLVSAIEDASVRAAVETERKLLASAGTGCRSALGVLATIGSEGDVLATAFVEDQRGARRAAVRASDPEAAAKALHEELAL